MRKTCEERRSLPTSLLKGHVAEEAGGASAEDDGEGKDDELAPASKREAQQVRRRGQGAGQANRHIPLHRTHHQMKE